MFHRTQHYIASLYRLTQRSVADRWTDGQMIPISHAADASNTEIMVTINNFGG